MHRQLLTLALFAAPALALAAPQQHLSETASAHPGPGAHTNAVAAQANATKLEGCDDLSSSMLDALEKDNFKAATSKFGPRMSASLDPKKLGALWKSMSTRLGALQSRGFPQATMYQELFIVVTPLYFEKGGLAAQVVCDMDGKIVGFHVRALPSASSGPASSVQ